MIEFQASPVEHRRRVKKEAPKDWKLTCLFISDAPSRSMRLNWDMPMIANMKMRSMRSRPSEPIAGVAEINVMKISCSFYYFLISRKTRPILSVLKIVPMISNYSPTPAQLRDKMTSVRTTTVKSKLFQPSLKYKQRWAINLMMASMVKMVTKQ